MRRLLLPLVLIVLLVAGLFSAMEYYDRRAAEAQRDSPIADDPEVSEPRPARLRDTPSDTAADTGDVGTDPLTETRQTLAEIQSAPSPADRNEEPAETLLYRPLAQSAGTLSFGDRTLHIDGIVVTESARTCSDASGRVWPCGMIARTAFRNYLRGRALTCTVAPDWSDGDSARCRLLDDDIGQWLVESGWAEAAPGSAYETLAETARSQGRGLFGTDPR
jgi:endonuclease YncB( thermonuclease family)